MKPSPYDGKRVVHVDGALNQHSGVIVGQSNDGKAVYVQADSMTTLPTQHWDFTVAMPLVPALIKNAQNHR